MRGKVGVWGGEAEDEVVADKDQGRAADGSGRGGLDDGALAQQKGEEAAVDPEDRARSADRRTAAR